MVSALIFCHAALGSQTDVGVLFDRVLALSPETLGYNLSASSYAKLQGLNLYEHEQPFAKEVYEFAKLGHRALPFLVDRIQNQKLTSLTISASQWKGLTVVPIYDPKDRTGNPVPLDDEVHPLREITDQKSYTVTEGDVAAFFLGTITNRLLFRIDSIQHNYIYTVNFDRKSRNAAIADWRHCTLTEYRKSLEQDMAQPDSYWRHMNGLTISMDQFRDTAEPSAIRCLGSLTREYPAESLPGAPRVLDLLEKIRTPKVDDAVAAFVKDIRSNKKALQLYPTVLLELLTFLLQNPKYGQLCLETAKGLQGEYEYITKAYEEIVRKLSGRGVLEFK